MRTSCYVDLADEHALHHAGAILLYATCLSLRNNNALSSTSVSLHHGHDVPRSSFARCVSSRSTAGSFVVLSLVIGLSFLAMCSMEDIDPSSQRYIVTREFPSRRCGFPLACWRFSASQETADTPSFLNHVYLPANRLFLAAVVGQGVNISGRTRVRNLPIALTPGWTVSIRSLARPVYSDCSF